MLQPFKVLKIDAKLIFFTNGDSPYHRYAESSTPRLNDTGSRQLSVSTIRGVGDSPTQRSTLLIRGVDDSPYHRYGKFSFKKFKSRLSVSVMRGVVDSAYPLNWWVVFFIWISPRIRSQNQNSTKCSVRDLCQTNLCKKLGKFGSLPCPFKFNFKQYTYTRPAESVQCPRKNEKYFFI
jgi:hypothetical protein